MAQEMAFARNHHGRFLKIMDSFQPCWRCHEVGRGETTLHCSGPVTAEYPFQKLSWDIMGQLPTSSQGNRYNYSSGDKPVHQMRGSISPLLYRIHSVGHSPGG